MYKLIKMINYMFWVEQVGVDPPRVKDPNVIPRLDMILGDVSS